MTKSMKFLGLAFLCLVWGMNWVAIKVTLEGIPPLTSAAVRFVLGTAAMLIYVLWKRVPIKLNAREFRLMLVTAFLIYALDYGLIFWGEQYLSAGVTSIFFSTFVLFTALFSNFVFKNEAFSWNKFLGLAVGLGGTFIVFYDQLILTQFNLLVILASVAIVLAAVCAAAATVIVKKFLPDMNPVKLTFHQLWMGTVFLVLIALLAEDPSQIQLNVRVSVAMFYMGVMASAVAFVVFYRVLKEMSAVTLSFIIYIIPLVALLGDYLLYGQVLPLRSFAGMVIIFSGIWLSREGKPKPAAKENAE